MSPSVLSAQFELSVVDDKGNPLQDAVAALVPAQKINYSTAPTAIVDQRQNMFVPGVLAIRVNTQVRFPNSDDVRHHVYSFSPAKKFELRLYHGMTAEPVLFDKPGTVVLGCNIHDSMVAYIYVVETDHFAVADALGEISLEAPAGKYQVQIYHPQMSGDFPESTITLDDSKSMSSKVIVNNLSAAKTSETTDEFSDLF
ncbi:MAG: methylamine utilization protein [Cellvibrio sp.]|uniref:methylamine utilization protein n=1 Tax=Cellvibrio sp. TaxID=1965322 RepID=UPI002720B5C7|nr:methylamine utilization protein [Cellvibrio sp.]